MAIKILADSACDLPESVIEKYNLTVYPIPVILDNEVFHDNITINSQKMFSDMKNGKIYKTSQIPRLYYEQAFLELCENDIDTEYIYVCFSSGLTKMYESSSMSFENIKLKYPNFKMNIIDTKCASLGYGLVVLKALELAESVKKQDELTELIKVYAGSMKHIFTVDNLAYLHRGGRLSKPSYLIGTALNIKPILHLDNNDGKLYPYRKTRGTKKMMHEIIEIMKTEGNNLSNQRIGISHGCDIEKVNEFKKLLKDEFEGIEILESIIGCAVGAHSGPGTLAVFFI